MAAALGHPHDEPGQEDETDRAVDERAEVEELPRPTTRRQVGRRHADDAQAAQHVDGPVAPAGGDAGWGSHRPDA